MARCDRCGEQSVRFRVPPALRDDAPVQPTAAVCGTCLDVREAATAPDRPAFDEIIRGFPTGDGGRAVALLLGTLPSVTLELEAAVALREAAERHGVDVHLTLDRLIEAAETGRLDPAFDLSRRVRQFESLADDV